MEKSRNVEVFFESQNYAGSSFVYLKVNGGQLESLGYIDPHIHFITCTVIILSCNDVLQL